jgi:hypothetical protein
MARSDLDPTAHRAKYSMNAQWPSRQTIGACDGSMAVHAPLSLPPQA